MKNVLVAYATNAGSTEEVAREIADELGKIGSTADVRRVEEVTDLHGYDLVVVGAPMIVGWHRAAVNFIRRNHAELEKMQVAYFATAMSLTQTPFTSPGQPPVCVDPELPKPPRNPQRLGLKERYATLGNYLRPMLQAAPAVRPVSIGFFGGKLELFRLKWWQALFVMVVIHAAPGDRRNWPFIREWAAQLQTSL